eukprot:gnl/TRDRNA2_/TRDRNA2_185064_c0_seq1.p1 gnl/TRDRNA2_/TRDRNA2_185064_c0~~gnl/TRDRNA2_/TRDRNA2_185064_c0_seq1.p1  ORF type:complete len:370 (-),score=74.19 gnl/TRDRNA2_/TRDRNA2_185064_c0_seq1:30-1139(-)
MGWSASESYAVTPVEPTRCSETGDDGDDGDALFIDSTAHVRVNLTTPPDKDNELLKVAAIHGPQGILSILRERRDYAWVVILGLRAIEVCLGPRGPKSLDVLQDCDPVAFAVQMRELEMIDEVFLLMRHFDQSLGAQRVGLAIIELLVMDDMEWRDEVARKGGVKLICDIARRWRDRPNILCQVMTCMSYLAAEDYIEVMLCQHDALEYVTHVLETFPKNAELVTRTCLALLNLTVCESHVEELVEKGAITYIHRVLKGYRSDVHVVIIICGVLANLSVNEAVRQELVFEGLFDDILAAMRLDASNAVLQVACLKAIVNYSTDAEHYLKMDEIGLPSQVGQAMIDHSDDPAVQKYGNFFLGQHVSCCVL